MVAIVTSTLFPQDKTTFGQPRSIFSTQERILQTAATIESLKNRGISKIFLVDNSDKEHFNTIKSEFGHVEFIPNTQYQFNNRSINEILMILYTLQFIPDNIPVLKISGRYKLNDNFTMSDNIQHDFTVKPYNFNKRNGIISTRCYIVKNKHIYEEFLKFCLTEIFGYSFRIVGIRSLINNIKQFLSPEELQEPTFSIEMAAAKTLKYKKYSVDKKDTIGVEGYIAGNNSYINE